MHTVASPDASTIAYDRCGDGPVVILVNGALGDRKLDRRFELMSGLAQLLAPDYTVINYDRRGRGASTEAGPFAMEREIEDVGAIGIPAPAVALMRLSRCGRRWRPTRTPCRMTGPRSASTTCKEIRLNHPSGRRSRCRRWW
jgi:pimeloyl-ACP methyl ester carboxylesterase